MIAHQKYKDAIYGNTGYILAGVKVISIASRLNCNIYFVKKSKKACLKQDICCIINIIYNFLFRIKSVGYLYDTTEGVDCMFFMQL